MCMSRTPLALRQLPSRDMQPTHCTGHQDADMLFTLWLEEAQSQEEAGNYHVGPELAAQPQAVLCPPSGDQVARLMTLNQLAEVAADALLLGQPLAPAEEAALLHLWPALLRLTAAMPSASLAPSTPASPFAAQATTVTLAQRSDACSAAPALSLTYPLAEPAAAVHLQQQQQWAAACSFDLASPPASTAEAAELEVFAHQLSRAVEQGSKEALEDTLSELSRLPSACAVSLVRSSIEGHAPPPALRDSLRSMLRRRSWSVGSPGESSTASSILRGSLTVPE